jgi:hypothetical protein
VKPPDARRRRSRKNRIEATNPEASQREKGKTMSNSKPTHSAYIVINPPEGSGRKAIWHEVGAVWPHKNGNGFDLVIPAGMSVSGRIVCTERKEKTAEQPE